MLALPYPALQAWAQTARGALLPLTIAVAARFVSEHQGGPALLYALLLGMVLNFLHAQPHIEQAAAICSTRVLRVGVALLGARITWAQFVHMGSTTLWLLGGCVLLTLAFSLALGRLLRWPPAEALVAGAAVAICGASAALAFAEALPRRSVRPSVVLLVVICVTCLSTTAMVVYPTVLHALGWQGQAAGIFLGATIHDVAQVVGAGYQMGHEAGDTASVTKMLRVAMLVPLVLLLGAAAGRSGGADHTPPRPWFLLGFMGLTALNSLGAIPITLQQALVPASQFCVLIAVAALGLRTSLQQLNHVGWKLPALLVADTLWIALLAAGGLLIQHRA